jgi:hypothetical protein
MYILQVKSNVKAKALLHSYVGLLHIIYFILYSNDLAWLK